METSQRHDQRVALQVAFDRQMSKKNILLQGKEMLREDFSGFRHWWNWWDWKKNQEKN